VYYRNQSPSQFSTSRTSELLNNRYKPRVNYQTIRNNNGYKNLYEESLLEFARDYPKLTTRCYSNYRNTLNTLNPRVENFSGKSTRSEYHNDKLSEKKDISTENYKLKNVEELLKDWVEKRLVRLREEMEERIVNKVEMRKDYVQMERLRKNIKENENNIEEYYKSMRKTIEETKKSIEEIKRKQKVQEVLHKKHIDEIYKKAASTEEVGYRKDNDSVQQLTKEIKSLKQKYEELK